MIEASCNLIPDRSFAYEYGYGQPVAPAHDRGYKRPQALCGDAEGPHSKLQTVRRVSQAVPGYRHGGGHPPVPTAPFGDGREHLQSQPHHDRAAVLVSRDAAAAGPCRPDLSPPRAAAGAAGDVP